MIAMLRRRLMSNMVKAKNIATGTVNAGNANWTTTSISAQTGFKPEHVAVFFALDSGNLDTMQNHILSVYDNSASYLDGSKRAYYRRTISFTTNAQGFTIKDNSGYYFVGTYRYVAWQE